jgi:hypothetical protein
MGQMLLEDMSINKCFFQVRISYVLGIISICHLFTDSSSYVDTYINTSFLGHLSSEHTEHSFSDVCIK